MKRIVVLIIAFTMASCCLKAQNYPFGKSRNSIRREIKSLFPFMTTSESTVCDTFSMPGAVGFRTVCYYRNSKCYMMKDICPLEFLKIFREMPANSAEKLKENTWTNLDDGAMRRLIIIKNKNQFVFEYVPVEKKE